jgi:hypothetical protein
VNLGASSVPPAGTVRRPLNESECLASYFPSSPSLPTAKLADGRWHRWNAVTHRCASPEQHLAWMKEQEKEVRRDEDYRNRVGTTIRMGRVLTMTTRL